MCNLTIDFRSMSSLNYRNAKTPRINMRKEQETKTFEENWKSQTLGLKSDLSGMPRIDGTTKRKRLENPGRPHSLPGATKKFPPLLLLSATHSDHSYRNIEVRRWEIHSVVWDWNIQVNDTSWPQRSFHLFCPVLIHFTSIDPDHSYRNIKVRRGEISTLLCYISRSSGYRNI